MAYNSDGERSGAERLHRLSLGRKGKWNLEQPGPGPARCPGKLSLLDIRDNGVVSGDFTWRQRKPAFSQRSAVTGDPSPRHRPKQLTLASGENGTVVGVRQA
ncbi:hypothetical protein MJ561_15915 [Klebsiella pneumoniae]|nr:hypothetical protein MJ561_15915 [Klebsiella pneumoniae]